MDTTTLDAAPVAPAHHQLEQAVVVVENLIGANDGQRFLLANQTPEHDCLLDDFTAVRSVLRSRGVDADALLAGFIVRLRQIIELNDAEYRGEHALNGTLTRLSTAAHAAVRSGDMGGALSIRGLRDRLVGPLAVWADPHATRPQLADAFRQIDQAIRGVSRDRLVNGSLAKQLGAGPHALLLTLIGGES
jgi:hypothetical protein